MGTTDSNNARSTAAYPARTAVYIGHRTDSRRWDHYESRPDDIFICTPPKSGTTWTQAICALLIFGRPDFEGQLTHISPWFDGSAAPFESCLATLKSQRHRRFIKTHTPLDGMPYEPSATYLMVYRDPRDTFFSMRNHIANMIATKIPPQMQGSPRAGFKTWVDAPFEPGVGDQRSLAAYVFHYQSFARFSHLPNFHFFHFADLKRDLPGSFVRFASALGIHDEEGAIRKLAEAATFENMKRNAATFTPGHNMGVWKDDNGFFNRGENAQWQGVLEDEDLAHYAGRIRELMDEADVGWLEHGGTPS